MTVTTVILKYCCAFKGQLQTQHKTIMKKFYTNLLRLFFMMSMMAFSIMSYAQGITVSGTIADETGQPAPGVNVIEKGTASGTSSDAQGKYSVTVAAGNATLVYSFIGY